MRSTTIAELLKILSKDELQRLDNLLIDIGNSGSSPRSQKRLRDWIEQKAINHNLSPKIGPSAPRNRIPSL